MRAASESVAVLASLFVVLGLGCAAGGGAAGVAQDSGVEASSTNPRADAGGGGVDASTSSSSGGLTDSGIITAIDTGYVQVCASKDPSGCAPQPACGDGIINQPSEECDDGNTLPGDGCSGICKIEPNYKCPTPGQPCVSTIVCGDGVVGPGEACDDGNTVSGDGCSSTCDLVEPGYVCRVPGQPCVRVYVCGDGHVDPNEGCDDGNATDGDGCNSRCQIRGRLQVHRVPERLFEDDLRRWHRRGIGGLRRRQHDAVRRLLGDVSARAQLQGGRVYIGVLATASSSETNNATTATCAMGMGARPRAQSSQDTRARTRDRRAIRTAPTATWSFPPRFATRTNRSIPTFSRPRRIKLQSWASCRRSSTPTTSPSHRRRTRSQTGTSIRRRRSASGIATPLASMRSSMVRSPFGTTARVDSSTSGRTRQDSSGCRMPIRWWCDNASCTAAACLTQLASTAGTVCLAPCTPYGAGNLAACTATPVYYDGNPVFFPVDGGPFNQTNSSLATIPPYYGGTWQNEPGGVMHNFSFTSEVKYWFTFTGSANAKLDFVGDDDVWVFVNHQLAVDIGGWHPPIEGSVTLSSKVGATFGLVDGSVYEIAVFQAERMTTGSSFKLTLSGFDMSPSVCVTNCGDGIVTPPEQCDDGSGNNTGAYGHCSPDCTFGPRCGDGITQTQDGEQCDDGTNDGAYGGCSPTCQIGPHCGDGIVQSPPEQCDDGVNDGSYGGCTSTCQIGPHCGDGILQSPPEQCDDGNNVSGDGCSSTCLLEKVNR